MDVPGCKATSCRVAVASPPPLQPHRLAKTYNIFLESASDDVANRDADADSAASVDTPFFPSLLDSVARPPNDAQPNDVQTNDAPNVDPPQPQLAFAKHNRIMTTAIANIKAPSGDTLTTTATPYWLISWHLWSGASFDPVRNLARTPSAPIVPSLST
jgi:hypothetical protein